MNQDRKATRIYLALVLGCCYGLGALELLFKTGMIYLFLARVFTVLPVAAAFLTRKVTGVDYPYSLSFRVWKNMKAWLYAALVPGLLIGGGAVLYYALFRNQYSGVFRVGMLLGNTASMEVRNPISFLLICVLIAALAVPVQLLELGEEVGWRQYLLGIQIRRYGNRKAVLINGLEWGIAHLPLIWFGFNYSLDNPGAPLSNMAMMLLFCLMLGFMISRITIQTGNSMFAAIIHGVVNVAAEIPVCLSRDLKNGLLGPNPTGLVTMIPVIVFALVLFMRLPGREHEPKDRAMR